MSVVKTSPKFVFITMKSINLAILLSVKIKHMTAYKLIILIIYLNTSLALRRGASRSFAIWHAIIQIRFSVSSHPLSNGIQNGLPTKCRNKSTTTYVQRSRCSDISGVRTVNISSLNRTTHDEIITTQAWSLPSPELDVKVREKSEVINSDTPSQTP